MNDGSILRGPEGATIRLIGPQERPDDAVGLHTFIERLPSVPAVLVDRHLDVLAANPTARALRPGLAVGENLALLAFPTIADPRRDDTDARVVGQIAAVLRDAIERYHEDARYRELIGRLVATSRRFAEAWAEMRASQTGGLARLTHPSVGELRLRYARFPLAGAAGAELVLATPDDAISAVRLQQLIRA